MTLRYDQVERRTQRLLLRPFVASDAPALFEVYRVPEVCRYLPRAAWTDISVAHDRIALDLKGMAANEHLRLAIVRREDGVLLGDCCLFSFSEQSRRAEIGYGQARHAWGQGYMHEALQALVDFAFGPLGLHRLEADIDPRNTASARSLERLGFTKEGHLRGRWIVDGEVSDTGLYGLLASDWQARGAGAPATATAANAATPHLRIARPVRDLDVAREMYTRGLGLSVLGSFIDHEGFDGVMLGAHGGPYHFEFTHCKTHTIAPAATQEDLAVFYVETPAEWKRRCAAMVAAGFRVVPAFNPYWDRNGRTFIDADGYRVVLNNGPWRSLSGSPSSG